MYKYTIQYREYQLLKIGNLYIQKHESLMIVNNYNKVKLKIQI